MRQWKHTNSTRVHRFGMWKETGVPENTIADTENMQTPHRQWPWPGTDVIVVFFHQHYNKTM